VDIPRCASARKKTIMLSNRTFKQLAAERYADVATDYKYNVHPSGKVFYVNSVTGSNSYGGLRRSSPFATLAAAYAACTASRGDTIVVSPFHTETTTAVLTVAKIGVRIIGEKIGNQRPVITVNGAIDGISLEAAACTVSGLKFAAPGTDAQTADINITAANCLVHDTVHVGSATSVNKVNIITIGAAAHDTLIDGIYVSNDVVEVVGAIILEGTSSRVEVRNCYIGDTIGYTSGAIYDAGVAADIYIHHNTFTNAKAGTVVMNFVSNSTGTAQHNFINGRHTTIQSNVVTGTGMTFCQNLGVEEVSKNGLLIPAADAE
jgi:hypothetical protein